MRRLTGCGNITVAVLDPAGGRAGRRRAAGVGYLSWRAATAGLLAATLPFPLTPTAAAAAGSVMPADTVMALPASPVTLAVPADGRLDGYRFAAQVLGAATGATLPGPPGVRAGTGQRLWVFGLRWKADAIPTQADAPGTPMTVAAVGAALVVDGQHIPIPLTQPGPPAGGNQPGTVQTADSGPEYFLASLPASPDVVVEISSGGYAQDFSLTHMAAHGPRPAALYRSAGSWDTVNPLGVERDIPTPYNNDSIDLPDAALIVKVPAVTLSYFGPDGTTDPAPAADQAWLVPTLEDPPQPTDSPSDALQYQANVTAADMTLTVAGQPPIHPKTLPGGPDPAQVATDGSTDSRNELFPYRYAFPVPADLTSATLTINFPPEPATPSYSGAAPIIVNPAPITIPVTFPPPATVTPPAGSATTPAALTSGRTSAAAIASNRAAPGGSVPASDTAAGVVAAAALAAGIILLRRRRNTLVGAPADPAPADLGPAGTTAGTPGPASGTGSPGNHSPAAPEDAGGHHTHPGPGAEPPPADSRQGTADGSREPPRSRLERPEQAVFAPPVPPALADPVVRVLGEVTVTGWAQPPARAAVTQLVVYLAVHPHRVISSDALLTALAAGNTERDVWLRSTVSRARSSLGPGRIPDAGVSGGYQLQNVTCDWTLFQDLSARAASHQGTGDTARAIDSYSQALALVTGPPLTGAGNSYAWVDTEGLRTHIERAISAAARTLAGLAQDAGEPELARWAACQALLANPLDESAAAALLRAAAASGQPGAARNAYAAITRDLAAHDVTPSPELQAIYEQLTRRDEEDEP